MSINLEVVSVDRQIDGLHRQERKVQVIGDILPFVLRKYGIDRSDWLLEIRELPQRFDYSV
jgi:hypothetical protein